jgi:hypothetical protein
MEESIVAVLAAWIAGGKGRDWARDTEEIVVAGAE